jgi:hypothetical protein
MVDELPDCDPACELSGDVPLLDDCAKQNPDRALATTNAKTFFMLNSPRIFPEVAVREVGCNPHSPR